MDSFYLFRVRVSRDGHEESHDAWFDRFTDYMCFLTMMDKLAIDNPKMVIKGQMVTRRSLALPVMLIPVSQHLASIRDKLNFNISPVYLMAVTWEMTDQAVAGAEKPCCPCMELLENIAYECADRKPKRAPESMDRNESVECFGEELEVEHHRKKSKPDL